MDTPGALSDDERSLVERVRPYTMTSVERILAVADAVDYVVRRGVPGALAECGVWRGGMALAMIHTLQRRGVLDRDVYLYDTFEGMTEPSAEDTSPFDAPALETWREAKAAGRTPWEWYFRPDLFSLEGVREVVHATGYPRERLHLVQGPVQETIPDAAPERLAVLRLDTDWYESTRHELVHLYPRLAPGGVLIVDDYGHWNGCRRAVDEYFAEHAPPVLFARTDYTGRMGVKA
jgi:hypothetical protein